MSALTIASLVSATLAGGSRAEVLILVVVGITGSLLVFSTELEHQLIQQGDRILNAFVPLH